jgi:predicted KAP-like P-loop ATPase
MSAMPQRIAQVEKYKIETKAFNDINDMLAKSGNKMSREYFNNILAEKKIQMQIKELSDQMRESLTPAERLKHPEFARED